MIGTTFQSTPSLRKVTFTPFSVSYAMAISIHTFLAEGDGAAVIGEALITLFQSTPSLRKVTCVGAAAEKSVHISIHTFLAEGD